MLFRLRKEARLLEINYQVGGKEQSLKAIQYKFSRCDCSLLR